VTVKHTKAAKRPRAAPDRVAPRTTSEARKPSARSARPALEGIHLFRAASARVAPRTASEARKPSARSARPASEGMTNDP